MQAFLTPSVEHGEKTRLDNSLPQIVWAQLQSVCLAIDTDGWRRCGRCRLNHQNGKSSHCKPICAPAPMARLLLIDRHPISQQVRCHDDPVHFRFLCHVGN
ncbi:MAG: hypothetical protein ACK5JI_09315, partial [Azonexus sp.]